MSNAQDFWNGRFAGDDYTYGTKPNDFLVEALTNETIGRAFSLGEGEGRNAVWMAEQGGEVASIDASDRGVSKTLALAEERGVHVAAQHGFLEDLTLADGRYDTIISIFAHTDPDLRRQLHRKVVDALSPGGVVVIEAYSPRQLAHGTGGPRDEELLVTVENLREELAGLHFEILHEVERDVVEGTLHTGRAAVVQCKARKPH
ncbi:MAG: class I SAM-dependent methyltransferase [Actinomycetota bacterium]